MSWYDERGDRASLDDELRSVLTPGGSEPDFDYDALVAGTTVRARRLRLRRALTQTAVAAVLVPTLVAAGWSIGTRLSVDGGAGQQVSVAGQTSEPTPEEAGVTGTDEAGTTWVDTAGRTDATVADGALTTATAIPTPAWAGPPFQDPAALQPIEPETNPDLPNREDVPDARPTGIPALDALPLVGGWLYPRTVPLMSFVAATDNIGLNPDDGVEPHSGLSVDWLDEGAYGQGAAVHAVTLNITAWDDAAFAMEQLRTGGTALSTFWMADGEGDALSVGRPTPLPWAGHDGSADHLLVTGSTGEQAAGALIREGNYLIGVTVYGQDSEAATDLAAEVAEQTAANLVALDPSRGQG